MKKNKKMHYSTLCCCCYFVVLFRFFFGEASIFASLPSLRDLSVYSINGPKENGGRRRQRGLPPLFSGDHISGVAQVSALHSVPPFCSWKVPALDFRAPAAPCGLSPVLRGPAWLFFSHSGFFPHAQNVHFVPRSHLSRIDCPALSLWSRPILHPASPVGPECCRSPLDGSSITPPLASQNI